MERIGARLKAVTFSPEDQIEGGVRIRRLEGYDVLFLVTRDSNVAYITIGGVILAEGSDPRASALKLAEKIATLRGAVGL